MPVATIKFSQFVAGSLSNTTNQIAGISSPSGGENILLQFPLEWTTATRPTDPALGLTGFNATTDQLEYWNGSTWISVASGGSGSVSSGLINELAWYAANGTAVSGLATANNGVLTTSAGGVPSISTTLPNMNIGTPTAAIMTNATGYLSGNVVPNNGVTPPSSGQIGQTIFAQVTQTSGITINNGADTVLTSINVPNGVWQLSGTIGFQDGTPNFVEGIGWINDDGVTVNDASLQTALQISGANAINQSGPVFYPIQTINSPKTFYLMAQQFNGAGSAINTFGYIQAIRIA